MSKTKLNKYIVESLKNKRLYELRYKLEYNISIYSNSTEILNLLGLLNLIYCRFKTAEKLWIKSYLIDENANSKRYICMLTSDEYKNMVTKYNESVLLFKESRYHEAIENLEVVIESNDKLIEPYILISLCYYKIKKLKKSLGYIKKANDFDKSNYRIYNIYKNAYKTYLSIIGKWVTLSACGILAISIVLLLISLLNQVSI